jgi:indole-3-glycerol phosphate synthase/phosphoribosylanthranilate isomerase
LGSIVEHKRREIADRRDHLPLGELLDRVGPSSRSLMEALGGDAVALILESKRASPSQGPMREPYDPAAIARSYAPYAAAISVLTDERFFGGSLDDLRAARTVVDVPLLCKDVVVDPYQIAEARDNGADAVLLMLSVLDDRTCAECLALTRQFGMDAIVEVHDSDELDRALQFDASIIGINNRDLRTLSVDLTVTEKLAAAVPEGKLVIGESGLRSNGDVRRVGPHVDALLVGTSLMAEPDLDSATRALAFGRVKVCGLTRPEDARAAWERGAVYGGVIFAAESPRCVNVEQAATIGDASPFGLVGVFVNEEPRAIVKMAKRLSLVAVQLHGEEPEQLIERLREMLPADCEIWNVVHVDEASPSSFDTVADRVVLEPRVAGQRGGTGQSFDWQTIASRPDCERIIVAGGITPENASVAAAVGAFALDVNSGVESSPGVKDAARISALFDALRVTGRRGAPR